MSQSLEYLTQQINDLMTADVSTSHTGTDTNADVVITLPATPGKRHLIQAVSWSYDNTPSGSLLIHDAGRLVYQVDITATGPDYLPVNKRGSAGAAMTVTLTAGGGSVVGRLNVNATM